MDKKKISLKPIKKKNRFGRVMYICPRCGRVFDNLKRYNKHISKSHSFLTKA